MQPGDALPPPTMGQIARFRRMQRGAVIVFAFAAAAFLVATGLLLGPGGPSTALAPVGWAILPLLAGSGLYLGWVRCPRCGDPFHRRGVLLAVSARSCVHCGLDADGRKPTAAQRSLDP